MLVTTRRVRCRRLVYIDGVAAYVAEGCIVLGHTWDVFANRCATCHAKDVWLQENEPELFVRAYYCERCGLAPKMPKRRVCKKCAYAECSAAVAKARVLRRQNRECLICAVPLQEHENRLCEKHHQKEAKRLQASAATEDGKAKKKKFAAKYKAQYQLEGKCEDGHDKQGQKVCPVCKAKRQQLYDDHICVSCRRNETYWMPNRGRWSVRCGACQEANQESKTKSKRGGV